jgi:hypothetical protein
MCLVENVVFCMCNKKASFGGYKQQQICNINAIRVQDNQALDDHKVAGLITNHDKLFKSGLICSANNSLLSNL